MIGRPKRADSFYFTKEWKELRRACLERDGFRCVTPGCGRPASVADHIVSRRAGGPDRLGNLRSLCPICDNRIREGRNGRRRNGGIVAITGADGWPIA